ncbi:hypothetical protein HS088_TW09G00078 [Tripterygium wilfordii]|uniref:Serine-rich protein-like protein n=1 Tax=Tripterygium wilfordii TaxID=458696 RepID=A0A7J7D727_TRIWF|nr:uncharacterized protein LOC120004814 [Tripterygium wilfordii]XP_038711655.1 uncharacterized protein LOC120005867 [Tripterygium wilfordii]KAF5742030.1 hypothetical protein HS088_TW09G00069 [Tripterygium wilfordii]KAF5742039.1 hypothetical protein HS088_TW09G00078 [Tripterygium wilfordii]
MAATSTSSRRSTGPTFRSHSPSGRFPSYSSPSSSSSAFAYSSSSFSSSASTFFHRSASPTRVNVCGHSAMSPSVRFSLDRSVSPNRSISTVGAKPPHQVVKRQSTPKRTCLCSPTTHPGSFRCSLHKNFGGNSQGGSVSASNRLNARRSAMTNSLVRIGGVEGDLVKRALAALIRPSSHQQRRRSAFQPRPSRLSVMSKAEDS